MSAQWTRVPLGTPQYARNAALEKFMYPSVHSTKNIGSLAGAPDGDQSSRTHSTFRPGARI
jgi:hypothetical protein